MRKYTLFIIALILGTLVTGAGVVWLVQALMGHESSPWTYLIIPAINIGPLVLCGAGEEWEKVQVSNTPFTKGNAVVRPIIPMHVRVVAAGPLKPEVLEPAIHYAGCEKVYNPNAACFCAVWDR